MRSTVVVAISLAFVQSTLALIPGLDPSGGGSLTCGAQDGGVNISLLDNYNCPGNGGFPTPGLTCGAQKGAVNLEILNNYGCNPQPPLLFKKTQKPADSKQKSGEKDASKNVHHEKRLMGILDGGDGPGTLDCGAQKGLVNLSAVNTYHCGGGNNPFGPPQPGMTCGSQRGVVNVELLDNMQC